MWVPVIMLKKYIFFKKRLNNENRPYDADSGNGNQYKNKDKYTKIRMN